MNHIILTSFCLDLANSDRIKLPVQKLVLLFLPQNCLGQCFPLGFCNNSSLELYRIKLFKFLNFIGKKFSSFELYRIKLFKFFNFVGKKFSSFELYRIKLFKFLNFIGKKFSHVFTSIPLNTSNIRSNHMCSFKIQFSCNSSSQNMHLFILPSLVITKKTFSVKSFNTKHTLYLYYPNDILLSIYILLFPSSTLF